MRQATENQCAQLDHFVDAVAPEERSPLATTLRILVHAAGESRGDLPGLLG